MWYKVVKTEKTADIELSAQVTTSASSPWYSGHFPGTPILPGIAQLGMVVDLISKFSNKELHLKNLSRVKFKKLITPGELLYIYACPARKEDSYSFRIEIGGQEVCSGIITVTI